MQNNNILNFKNYFTYLFICFFVIECVVLGWKDKFFQEYHVHLP